MEKTKIGIVGGLGHIGLVQAACLAKLGYQTVAYDKNLTKVEKIFQGILPFFEAGLEEIVQSTIKNGLLHLHPVSGTCRKVILFLSVWAHLLCPPEKQIPPRYIQRWKKLLEIETITVWLQ